MNNSLKYLFIVVTTLAAFSVVHAENTVHVYGKVTENIPNGWFGCKKVPMKKTKVRIQRTTDAVFDVEVTTNNNGYYSFNVNNQNSNRKFAVYLPDEVTTDMVYKNITPCSGDGEVCSKRADLDWWIPDVCGF